MLPLLKRLWVNTLRANLIRPARSQGSARLVLETLEGRLTPSNFFVRPSGNDHNDGLSPNTAWQTINKVNNEAYLLQRGDTINFEGGATYYGSLSFFQNNGTVDNPITVTSYNGRATINSGDTDGIDLADLSNFVVSNLNFVGTSSGRVVANGIGIGINGSSASHIYIDNVDVSGYGGQGITAYAGTNRTLQDLRITHAVVHDDVHAPGAWVCSIAVWGNQSWERSISDLYIGDVNIHDNVNGAGIYLANVTGGLVERSVVHDLVNSDQTIAISPWNSDHLIFQYNEAYSIVDSGGTDGTGFFIGNGITDSIIQYNYTHDNDGFGFALTPDHPGGAPIRGITVRYNISENDARRDPYYSGIVVAQDVEDAEIYNNTVYITHNSSTPCVDISVWGWTGVSLHIRNNILLADPGSLNISTNLSSRDTSRDLVLQGNAYSTGDGRFSVSYGDASFNDLPTWQNATGQELLADGTPVGYAGDPQLVAPGQGGTIGNPDLLDTLYAYNLQPTSPVSQIGLDLLGLFGIDPGAQDFYRDPMPQGGVFSIGAFQAYTSMGPQGELRGITTAQGSQVLREVSVEQIRINTSLSALVSESLSFGHKRKDAGGVDLLGFTRPEIP